MATAPLQLLLLPLLPTAQQLVLRAVLHDALGCHPDVALPPSLLAPGDSDSSGSVGGGGTCDSDRRVLLLLLPPRQLGEPARWRVMCLCTGALWLPVLAACAREELAAAAAVAAAAGGGAAGPCTGMCVFVASGAWRFGDARAGQLRVEDTLVYDGALVAGRASSGERLRLAARVLPPVGAGLPIGVVTAPVETDALRPRELRHPPRRILPLSPLCPPPPPQSQSSLPPPPPPSPRPPPPPPPLLRSHPARALRSAACAPAPAAAPAPAGAPARAAAPAPAVPAPPGRRRARR